MAETSIPTDGPAVKAEPLIRGVGQYVRRDKTVARIVGPAIHNTWPWRDEDGDTYTPDGYLVRKDRPDPRDIVAGPFPDEAVPQQADQKELAGLRGYAGVQDGRLIYFATSDKAFSYGWDQVIDLSTITKDQLVQSKPEPKRVKGWVNMYPSASTSMWPTKEAADAIAAPHRIACIPVEFTEGDGLGDGS